VLDLLVAPKLDGKHKTNEQVKKKYEQLEELGRA
jgi:hypothetical protein